MAITQVRCKTNHVREKLRQSGDQGLLLGLGSAMVAEQMAHCGFDFIVIETEHNCIDMAQGQQTLMAINGTDAIPLVRLPNSDQVFIQRSRASARVELPPYEVVPALLGGVDHCRQAGRDPLQAMEIKRELAALRAAVDADGRRTCYLLSVGVVQAAAAPSLRARCVRQ